MSEKSKKNSDPTGYFQIVSGVNNLAEVEPLARAGAAELFGGIYLSGPGGWNQSNRREWKFMNFDGPAEVAAYARRCADLGIRSSLTLNYFYDQRQMDRLVELLPQILDCGLDALIVSDIGLMREIRKRDKQVDIYLSLVAGCLNSRAIDFYARFNIRRVILPRQLTLPEIGGMVRPGMEYEILLYGDRCLNIDGFCGHSHVTPVATVNKLINSRLARFAIDRLPESWKQAVGGKGNFQPCLRDRNMRAVYTQPEYQESDTGWQDVNLLQTAQPLIGGTCGFCSLSALYPGVRYLKMSNRGRVLADKIKMIEFARQNIATFEKNRPDNPTGESFNAEVRANYQKSHGTACHTGLCYYYLEEDALPPGILQRLEAGRTPDKAQKPGGKT